MLARDATFGAMDLPGQTTAAAFLPSSDATPPFEFIGATPGRRAWVRMADADTNFALLTTTGQIDPAFGTGGTVSLDDLRLLAYLGETVQEIEHHHDKVPTLLGDA